jgi:hypothetical protein
MLFYCPALKGGAIVSDLKWALAQHCVFAKLSGASIRKIAVKM